MSSTVISIEQLSKQYRLGVINHGMLYKDLKSLWARLRSKEDPYSKIGGSHPGIGDPRVEGDRFWALKDICLQVNEGERVGIIGRNGAGKSTLLKILSRITAPTAGEVKIKGRVASLLEVGTGFHPELTGRENVFLNGAILGMSRRETERKLDEIVAFAEIEQFIDTPVKRYSSGMQVRLAFAVAAHLEPDILVVDEVLAVGDMAFQTKCVRKMEDVSAKEGRTVLFVSHNLSAVLNLCSRVVLIDRGTVIVDGLPEMVINSYHQLVAARSGQSLAERRDRRGNGWIRFKTIQFADDRNHITEIIRCGEPFSIALSIASTDPQYERRPLRVDIGIDDQLGARVAWLSSTVHQAEMLSAKGCVVFKVHKAQLVPGIYRLTLYLEIGHDVADWVTDAAELTIVPSDYYRSGRDVARGQGHIVLDYHIVSVPK